MKDNACKLTEGRQYVVKKDLQVGELYGGYRFDEKMTPYRGQKVTVTAIFPGTNALFIQEDNQVYSWTRSMLEEFNTTSYQQEMENNKQVLVDADYLKELEDKSNILYSLEALGVDNWWGYSEAMSFYKQEFEGEEDE